MIRVRAMLIAAGVLITAAPAAFARDSLGMFDSWGAFRDPQVPRCYAIAKAQGAGGGYSGGGSSLGAATTTYLSAAPSEILLPGSAATSTTGPSHPRITSSSRASSFPARRRSPTPRRRCGSSR